MTHEHHTPAPGEKKHFFDSPDNTKWLFRAFYLICALLIVAGHEHPLAF